MGLKNKILLVLIIISCFKSIGQARLNYTEIEIKKSLPNVIFSKDSTEDGTLFISHETKEFIWGYYFDKNGKSYLNMMFPKDQELIPALIEHYNKTKVIISDKKWKSYEQGTVVNIELFYFKKKESYVFFLSL